MLTLNIGGKDYNIEFTIEASLYNECTEKVTNLMVSIGEAQDKADIKSVLSSMSDIPQTTLTMFYAGLLEHHGADVGDGAIASIRDAKLLIRKYFDEHKEDDKGNFYSVMEMLIEQMGEDGFFRQIGLEQMMKKGSQKPVKVPQDHKKKAVKTGEK